MYNDSIYVALKGLYAFRPMAGSPFGRLQGWSGILPTFVACSWHFSENCDDWNVQEESHTVLLHPKPLFPKQMALVSAAKRGSLDMFRHVLVGQTLHLRPSRFLVEATPEVRQGGGRRNHLGSIQFERHDKACKTLIDIANWCQLMLIDANCMYSDCTHCNSM